MRPRRRGGQRVAFSDPRSAKREIQVLKFQAAENPRRIFMTIEEKLALLTETIEAEPGDLRPETELSSLDLWDSLAKLSVMAMFSSTFKREIEVEKVRNFGTVADILAEMRE
jgi:acyl carrier protein